MNKLNDVTCHISIQTASNALFFHHFSVSIGMLMLFAFISNTERTKKEENRRAFVSVDWCLCVICVHATPFNLCEFKLDAVSRHSSTTFFLPRKYTFAPSDSQINLERLELTWILLISIRFTFVKWFCSLVADSRLDRALIFHLQHKRKICMRER